MLYKGRFVNWAILRAGAARRNKGGLAESSVPYVNGPLTGKIPASRLPANQNAWPSPKYLSELNKFMFAGAA